MNLTVAQRYRYQMSIKQIRQYNKMIKATPASPTSLQKKKKHKSLIVT